MTQDYFSVLGFPAGFELDATLLQKRYFDAQRKFHPDKATGKSETEKREAVLASMFINQAYETLKSPLSRAQYLLSLNGITVGSERDSVKPSHILLTEMMELREALAETKTLKEIEMLQVRNEVEEKKTLIKLTHALSAKAYTEAAELTIRLGYITKLVEEIRVKKKGVAA